MISMNRLIFVAAVMVVCLLAGMSCAYALDPYASLFNFQFTNLHEVVIDDTESVISSILAFHETSQGWILHIVRNDDDAPPYDNFHFNFACDGIGSGSFNTTSYSSWNSSGVIDVNMEYGNPSYQIAYNSVPFTAKYTRCVFNITSDSSSFNNNSAYSILHVESIPLLATIEFLSCAQMSSPAVSFTAELTSLVVIMSDMWTIAWLVYSIGAVVFAVFVVPTMIFLLVRFALYKLTNYKIGGSEND